MIPAEIISELEFKTSRSGGAGGQNVNKVETKVQLLFRIETSQYLNEEQKNTLYEKLQNRISNEGILTLTSDTSRSQLANKELVVKRFLELITHALKPQKPRKKTMVPQSIKVARLENKKIQSEKKSSRKKPDF